jgi:hypothetical protein
MTDILRDDAIDIDKADVSLEHAVGYLAESTSARKETIVTT